MTEGKQGMSKSVASIVAIVLGIIAAVMSWMPIINNFAFIIGAVGLIFAIVGLVGVLRGKKSGKGFAIAALVINVAALAIVLGTQSMYSAAIDDAISGAEATGTSQSSTESGSDNTTADDTETTDGYTDLTVGTTLELDSGLTVTVDSVETGLVNYDGSEIVGVQVTYVNNSDETASYNEYDWKGEDAQGAQEYCTYYSEATNSLSSGTLAAGGTVSGMLYFEADTIRVLYFSSVISNEATASWALS